MTEKTLNTIIVLRNDKSTAWADSDVVLRDGELGVSYLDNGNVVVKAGDGEHKFAELKQVEGVFEQPVTLTQNFGYYNDVPSGGYKTYEGTAGMTTSEFLLSALKKTVEPTINQPKANLTATAITENDNTEMGAYITGVDWTGTFSAGSYVIGETTQSTGLTKDNTTWSVSNNIDSNTSTAMEGTFNFATDKYKQIDVEGSAVYVTVSADVTLDASGANIPKNNLGENTVGVITATTAGAPWTKSADAKLTGYRKPFWGVNTETINIDIITSDQVRALSNSGTSTASLPSTLVVPVGATQAILCAKAGTYTKKLQAIDSANMNAPVDFEKFASAVNVEGANGYKAIAYDLWEAHWSAPIAKAKSLEFTWVN